jgi:hypothetical protein
MRVIAPAALVVAVIVTVSLDLQQGPSDPPVPATGAGAGAAGGHLRAGSPGVPVASRAQAGIARQAIWQGQAPGVSPWPGAETRKAVPNTLNPSPGVQFRPDERAPVNSPDDGTAGMRGWDGQLETPGDSRFRPLRQGPRERYEDTPMAVPPRPVLPPAFGTGRPQPYPAPWGRGY